jgi:hypothetical protein
MSVRTKDDIMAQIGDALDVLEEMDHSSVKAILSAVSQARGILRQMHVELAKGEAERAKQRRRKAKARTLSTGAMVPLWEDQ